MAGVSAEQRKRAAAAKEAGSFLARARKLKDGIDTVHLDDLGPVKIRRLIVGEHEDSIAAATDPDTGVVDQRLLNAHMIVRASVEPRFSIEQAEELRDGMPAGSFRKLAARVQIHSGLHQGVIDHMGDQFPPEPAAGAEAPDR